MQIKQQPTLIKVCLFGLILTVLHTLAWGQVSTSKQWSIIHSPYQQSNNHQIRQEIEIESRKKIITIHQKAMECIKNSQNIEMINICKGEENTELNVVKQEKKEAEKTFLKKKKNALGQPVE